ncbi:NAD(P)(+) transhydrogenase (Re/Si-specific) subunit alpha, partial [Pandoraea sp. NPDC087047]
MKIGIPAETLAGESRVAATPETVKKLVASGHQVIVGHGAGDAASVPDAAFAAAGATLSNAADALGAELVLKVRAPSSDELAQIPRGTVVVGMLNPFDAENNARMAAAGIIGFALEAAPR